MATGKRAGVHHKYGGGGRRPDLREIRRKEALERQTGWAELTFKAQLQALDSRLGKGVGAKKQRERIRNKMETAKHAPKKPERNSAEG